jgi:hypothetical protein
LDTPSKAAAAEEEEEEERFTFGRNILVKYYLSGTFQKTTFRTQFAKQHHVDVFTQISMSVHCSSVAVSQARNNFTGFF